MKSTLAERKKNFISRVEKEVELVQGNIIKPKEENNLDILLNFRVTNKIS